jgi:hypothetical protein
MENTDAGECTRRRIAFVPFGSLGFGATGRRRSCGDENDGAVVTTPCYVRLGVTPLTVGDTEL